MKSLALTPTTQFLNFDNKDFTNTYFVSQSWINNDITNFSIKNANKKNFLNAQQVTQWLKKEGMPISAIADISKVERKTIYSWLEGTIAKELNLVRLQIIYDLLNYNKQADLRSLYRLWNRKVDGVSLSSVFLTDKLDQDRIMYILNKLWPEAKKYMSWEKSNSENRLTRNNPILQEIRDASSEYGRLLPGTVSCVKPNKGVKSDGKK